MDSEVQIQNETETLIKTARLLDRPILIPYLILDFLVK